MGEYLGKKISDVLRQKSERRKWVRAIVSLSLAVLLVTNSLLALRGVALSQDEHTHTDACYEEETTLVCGQEESDGHQHTDECYTRVRGELICQDTSEDHVHTDDCYEWHDELTCATEEGEGAHHHTEECYHTERTLVCGMVETRTAKGEEPGKDAEAAAAENGEAEAEVGAAEGTGVEGEAAVETTEQIPAVAAEMPAQRFEAETEDHDLKIVVEADAGTFPIGTTMEIEEIAEDDEEVTKAVTDTMEKDNRLENEEVVAMKAVDIKFLNAEGVEIEPLLPVRVTMTSETIKQSENVVIVHLDDEDEDKNEVIEQKDNEELKQLEIEPAEDQVVFEAEKFSKYVIVGTETLTGGFVSANGSTYEVTVTYGPEAGIPKGSTLELVEFSEDSEEYLFAKNKLDEYWTVENLPTDETEVTSEEAENIENTEDQFGFSALGISILDPEGNPIEPTATVSVSIVMKSLPEGFEADDLQQTMEVHHLAEKDGEIVVEQVASPIYVGSEIVADENGASIEFTTESFSTYTVTWGNNNANSVTLRIVDDQGRDLTGVQHNGTTIDGQTIALTSLIGTNNQTLDLTTYFTKEGYTYSNTFVTGYNGSSGTCIGNVLRRTTSGRQPVIQYATYPGENSYTTIASGSTLYLVMSPVKGSDGGGSGGEDDPETPDLGEIGHDKHVEPNNDGTYKVSLSVSGTAQNKTEDTDINVAFVIDVSSSMGSLYGWRIDDTKEAVKNMAYGLFQNKTESNPDAIEVALFTFDQAGHTIPLGGGTWTNDYNAFASAVGTGHTSGIEIGNGTNWEEGLDLAATINKGDGDPTYVIFFTDGQPTQYLNHYQKDTHTARCYWPARDEARTIVNNGKYLYGIFAYGDDNQDYLGQLIDYAYNDSNAKSTYRYNASETSDVEQALEEILDTINMNFAYANVEIDDGITGLSTVVFEHIDTESFAYTIKYRNYTTTTQYTEEELVLTPNADGTVTIPSKTYGMLDSNAEGGVRTITTEEVTVNGATFDTTSGKSVTWDMKKASGTGDAAIYMLEGGWTYTVSFDVWPSQTSYDLVAALNNHIINYGDDYHYTDENNQNQTIPFTEYKEQITSNAPYTLKTNTNASVKYQQVTEVVDKDGNVSYEYGEEKTVPITYTGSMGLVSQEMPVKKDFAHSINAQDPYAQIRFYIMMNDEYYQSDGTLSHVLVPYTGSGDSITPEVHTIGMDLSAANNWTSNIYIAPGVIVDERSTGGEMEVLESGHTYSLYEVITEGNVYEYEFTPQAVRPMVVNGSLKYLVKQDKYNTPASGATTYTIEGETYYEAPANAQALIGTNRKTAELDITKIVSDPDNLMTDAEENAETFTYRVTLQIPDRYPNGTPVDPAGIVGYEYVPRTQSNAFTLYGYQSTDANQGFAEDVARFNGKTFRGWNTLIYRDLAQWANVDGRIVSLKDDNGNILWNIPAVDGYHTITYDMTLKQDEVIRFTNLPSGTIYTIQEIYANKYPADNAGGITSGRAPISDPSNIADEGYEITRVQHTGGTVSGDTVTGTIEDLDTRYYNQFTNTVVSHEAVNAELKVKKVTEYTWPTDQYYRFTLAAGTATYADGSTGTSPMPDNTAESTNSVRDIYDDDRTPDHTASFGTIRYEQAGTYTYTVTESWAPAYAQKPDAATITVTVESQNDRLVVTNITDDLGTTEYTAATNTNLATGLTTQTNKIKTIDVSATKEWLKSDGTTVLVTPPAGSKVTFTLYQNGEATDQTVELDGEIDQTGELAAWVATFSDLPQYTVTTVETTTGEGADAVTTYTNTYEAITYTIGETTTCPGFELVTTEPVANGGTIQNKQLAREVTIQKRQQDGATPLAGAIFDLYTKEGYESTPKADPIKTNLESLATEGKVGLIELGELTYGDYYLVETKAPDGYNKLTEAVGLKVEGNRLTITQGSSMRVDNTPDDTTYDAFITNDEGVELPAAGGPGTLLYTLSGIALMLGAALMYGFRLRRRERRLY